MTMEILEKKDFFIFSEIMNATSFAEALKLPKHSAQDEKSAPVLLEPVNFSLDKFYKKCCNYWCVKSLSTKEKGNFCSTCKKNGIDTHLTNPL